MEERLTQHQRNILSSAIRRGIPLPEDERGQYANNVRALLRMSDSFVETSELLAEDCISQLSAFDKSVDEIWKAGVVEEIQWWWSWTLKLKHEGKLENWANFKANKFPYEQYVDQFDKNHTLRILNIGCGPRSTMGEKSAHPKLEFTHMDPLSSAYNKLMILLNAPGTGDIVFGAVEVLDQLDLQKFNIISAKNCLDHAYDVPKGILKIINQMDDKGLIELEHYENEGEAQNYLGMHKWNIEIKEYKIHIWNQHEDFFLDHQKFGLDLNFSRTMVKKGSGKPHPKISIWLTRELENLQDIQKLERKFEE